VKGALSRAVLSDGKGALRESSDDSCWAAFFDKQCDVFAELEVRCAFNALSDSADDSSWNDHRLP
jgi:hypothetical protein